MSDQNSTTERRNHKYPALKIIEIFLKIYGWLSLAAVIYLITRINSDEISVGIGAIILVLMIALLSFAYAELIQVALDIEENTHKAASKLASLQGLSSASVETGIVDLNRI